MTRTGPASLSAATPGAWYRGVDRRARRALFAAFLGWMLDGMDVMLFAFALTAIREEFGLSAAAAGGLASLTLITSAVGGTLAGYAADRYGRVRLLIVSILIYSLCTGATALARTLFQLALCRALVGFGLGAEWSAGSVLVAESWPAAHRGKAIGFVQSGWAIGYILAALLSAVVLPAWGWRALFLLGIAPALLTLWVRRSVDEPEIWLRRSGGTGAANRARGAHVDLPRAERPDVMAIVRPPLLRFTLAASLLCAVVLFAYWGLFTWIPTFLASPVEKGGAGLGMVRSSLYIVPMQIGAFLGYFLFGVAADRIGRRPAFLVFVLGAAGLVPLYGLFARSPLSLLMLGPCIGFFGHGYFSLFGAMLAELFPSAVRATAQGLCYNSGRAISALAPFAIGAAADRWGYGSALALTASFFLAAAGLIFLLPETRGRELA